MIVQNTQAKSALSDAINYLVMNYNSTVGLIPEIPHGNTYWLYSDNFLASLALERYSNYTGNITYANIATKIVSSISGYVNMSSVLNQYLVLDSSIEVNVSIFNNASSNLLFQYYSGNNAGAVINITLNNGPIELNSTQYADIAFLEAFYFSKNNDPNNTLANYQFGQITYNNIGTNDSVFYGNDSQNGQYQTYKLALYIYASKFLNYSFPQSAEVNLLKMQAPSGGFYSGYDTCFSNNGTDTNTETTSLAILALLPQPPTTHVSSIPEFPTFIVAAIVLSVSSAGKIFYKKHSDYSRFTKD